ncbi:MAG: DUF4935 domain-containing protein [Microcoleus vaginatus WJT46-NPBG5]|jgi:hypothetical protein|nr:DUF4935 domain-containing protein [Microcoleus vaginatus WJT46-NPBG5]
MPILYVETNFLISIATGRDPEADNLLLNPPASVQIAIPSICCMEALSVLENEQKRRNRFTGELENQISQLKRDLTSRSAKSLLFHLEESLNENEGLLNDVQLRLFQALENVATKAEMINLNAVMLQENLKTTLILEDPTDNLILHCILNHACSNATEVKAFLSGNSKQFGVRQVQEALQDVGIEKYFFRSQDFLGWLNFGQIL